MRRPIRLVGRTGRAGSERVGEREPGGNPSSQHHGAAAAAGRSSPEHA